MNKLETPETMTRLSPAGFRATVNSTVLLGVVLSLLPTLACPQGKPNIKWMKPGHGWQVRARYSPNGEYFASSGYDGSVKIWRGSDGEYIRTIDGVWSADVAFSPNSAILAIGSGQG